MGGPRCPGDPHPWTPASRASPPSRGPGIHRPPQPRGPGVQGITPTHGPPCLGSTPSNPHSPPRPRYLGAPPAPEPGTPPRTLAVAQQVDAISGVGHDGGQRAAEPLHLHPQRPQRCPPVEEVQDRHLRPWVALGGRRQGCGCQRGGVKGGTGIWARDTGVCGGPKRPGGDVGGPRCLWGTQASRGAHTGGLWHPRGLGGGPESGQGQVSGRGHRGHPGGRKGGARGGAGGDPGVRAGQRGRPKRSRGVVPEAEGVDTGPPACGWDEGGRDPGARVGSRRGPRCRGGGAG